VVIAIARNLPVAGGKRALELTAVQSFLTPHRFAVREDFLCGGGAGWRATQRHHRTKNLVVACGDARKLGTWGQLA